MTVAQRCICDTDAQHKMLSLRKSLEVAKTRFDYQRIIWLALICQGVDTPAQLTNDLGEKEHLNVQLLHKLRQIHSS